MSVQDIVDFEAQLRKLWDFWQPKLTHGEMVGTWEIVRLDYQLGRLMDNAKTEMCETPVIGGEQAMGKSTTGSPIPAEVTDG